MNRRQFLKYSAAVNKAQLRNVGFYILEADADVTYAFDFMRWPPEAMWQINNKPKWELW
ncbi:MAG: hypothetical protein H8E14_07865 [Candidatus Marinimicrobia bacterium]|nr:hypothetical protein [Candidatus Neomarinimicrobiota bacterium]